MTRRLYSADHVDAYLISLRRGFQDSISRAIAESQSTSSPVIDQMKAVDSVLATVENFLPMTVVHEPPKRRKIKKVEGADE